MCVCVCVCVCVCECGGKRSWAVERQARVQISAHTSCFVTEFFRGYD